MGIFEEFDVWFILDLLELFWCRQDEFFLKSANIFPKGKIMHNYGMISLKNTLYNLYEFRYFLDEN